MLNLIRRWLIAGLLVWLPLVATVLVLRLFLQLMDQSLLLMPPAWRPEQLLGIHIPGFGALLCLLLVLLTGALVANFIGRRALALSERLLERVPLVRSIYSGVKRLTAAVVSEDGTSFRRVVLVEYPREGIWTLGFQTGDPAREVEAEIGESVTVYVPTTPNPTSGFVIFVQPEHLKPLDMPVEDALKMVMTLGVVTPERAQLEAKAAKP